MNNKIHVQNETFLNAKTLAWCDLIFGLIPFLFLLLIVIYFVMAPDDGFGKLAAVAFLMFFGIPVVIYLILHIFSFIYLKNNNYKGITISLTTKYIILALSLSYLAFAIMTGGYFLAAYFIMIFIMINTILTIVLIKFNFIVKKQLLKNTQQGQH